MQLVLWSGFVLLFATISYADRWAGGRPPKDILYRWATVGGNLFQYAVIALIVYGLAGLGNRREQLALRRPASWGRAARIGVSVVIAIFILTGILNPLLHAGREQGLTPTRWEPAHAAAYVANSVVIVFFAPFVEELTFRGLGFSLLRRYGEWTAILLVGLLFGLAHGLVEALPLLVAFGTGLAYLRSRADSVIPGMIVHALFNAISLAVAVTA